MNKVEEIKEEVVKEEDEMEEVTESEDVDMDA